MFESWSVIESITEVLISSGAPEEINLGTGKFEYSLHAVEHHVHNAKLHIGLGEHGLEDF